MKTVALDKIRIDCGTQARAELNQDAVRDYAQAVKGGAVLPAVEVYFDGSSYYLVDGFHRYFAAKKNGAKSMRCEVVNGSLHEARLRACAVNASHGLQRSNADKRRSVNLCLDELTEGGEAWSERQIAKHCGVSHQLVGEVRAERGERERAASYQQRDDGKVVTVTTQNPPSELETAVSQDGGDEWEDAESGESAGHRMAPNVESGAGNAASFQPDSPAPVGEAGDSQSKTKPKNGREVISHKDRKKVFDQWGVMVRAINDIGKLDEVRPQADIISEALKV